MTNSQLRLLTELHNRMARNRDRTGRSEEYTVPFGEREFEALGQVLREVARDEPAREGPSKPEPEAVPTPQQWSQWATLRDSIREYGRQRQVEAAIAHLHAVHGRIASDEQIALDIERIMAALAQAFAVDVAALRLLLNDPTLLKGIP